MANREAPRFLRTKRALAAAGAVAVLLEPASCSSDAPQRPAHSASATQSSEFIAPTLSLADRSAAVLREPTTPDNAVFKSLVELQSGPAKRIIDLAARDKAHKQEATGNDITTTVYAVPDGDGPYSRLTVDKVTGDANPTSVKGFSLIVSSELEQPKVGSGELYSLDMKWAAGGFQLRETSVSGNQRQVMLMVGQYGDGYAVPGAIALSTVVNEGKPDSTGSNLTAIGVQKIQDRIKNVLSTVEKKSTTRGKVVFISPRISFK